MNKTIQQACIALAIFVAVFVAPSPASASPELTSPTGTRAPVGTLLQGTNVEHGETSKVLKMTTSVGTFECAEATLTGELTSNQEAHVAGNVTTTEFRGTPAAPTSPHCAGPGGLGTITITPSHITNPSHNGVSSLPWCITADAVADQFTVRGGKCSEAARNLTFILHSTTIGPCTYQKTSVTGTYTTHPAAAVLTIQSQKFTKITGSPFCPSEGSLDMAFTLETDPEGKAGQDVYID